MKLDVPVFLTKGTFFCGEIHKEKAIEFIQSQCTYKFGDDTQGILYSFEREHYNIEFIFDDDNQMIKGEQVEVHRKPSAFCLSSIFEYIERIYSDAVETVAFMKNGHNVYFYNKQLIKITSKSQASRNFAIKIMDRIY